MPHPTPVILGYSEAAMFLRDTSNFNVNAIISIHGQREYGVDFDVSHRLDLTFDDVDVPNANDSMAIQRAWSRRRWCEQNGLIEAAPTLADATAIIHFANKLRDNEGILLCHCGAGVSRAPAAALICLAVWSGLGSESQCVKDILKIRPSAFPHIGLLSLADEIIGKVSRLVDAAFAARCRPQFTVTPPPPT